MTPRLISKLIEQGLKDILVQPEEMAGRYLASDMIDEKNGVVLFEFGDELTMSIMEQIEKALGSRNCKSLASIMSMSALISAIHWPLIRTKPAKMR